MLTHLALKDFAVVSAAELDFGPGMTVISPADATEMAQAKEFDFVIINELFERALFDLKAIVHAQRLKFLSQRRARADTFSALGLL